MDHLGTRNVARDMDAIRQALGEEQVTYVGYSYGTRLGSVYADLFPERVRAMVLDGAVDNSLTNSDAGLQQALGFERALDRFVDHCREEGCGLDGDPGEVIDEVIAAAEEEPIPAPSASREARPGEVLLGIIVPLYQDQSWSFLAGALDDAHEGDASMLVNLADTYLGIASTAVLNAVNCIDSQAPGNSVDTWAEYQEALPEYREVAPTFGPTVVVDSCQYWNGGADPIGVPDAESAAPILVIGTTGDPATPYEWAEALAGQLESASLLRHEGGGHTVYLLGGSECVDELVNDYILELDVPASGTTCTGDEDPVPPSADDGSPDSEPTPAPGDGQSGGDGDDGAAEDSSAAPPPPAAGESAGQGLDATRIGLLAGTAALVIAIGAAAVVLGRR
ncbi:MAG: alpha/beta hydrolase [Dehalococcoidia bacterium]|nr:alpha/beta hydrolase [Dehalococcoidia bacterium]